MIISVIFRVLIMFSKESVHLKHLKEPCNWGPHAHAATPQPPVWPKLAQKPKKTWTLETLFEFGSSRSRGYFP